MEGTVHEPGFETSRPPKLSKAAKKANLKAQSHYDEVNVLVTGFGAVDNIINPNPSWRVAKSLPPALPANAAHPTRIRIIVHPEPIQSTYSAILKVTPQLFDMYSPVHLILHLATTLDDRSHYALEHIANKSGYAQADEDGHHVDLRQEPHYWAGLDDQLSSSAAWKDVLKRWSSDIPEIDVRSSSSAGHNVAEYQFFASLARIQQPSNKTAWQDRTMVACMHLPQGDSPEELEQGKKVVISLIYALIDSRRYRDGDYDDEEGEQGHIGDQDPGGQ